MAAVANNPSLAKKLKIPQSVGKEFLDADKGKKFKEGGMTMKHEDIKMDKKIAKKAIGMHDKQMHGGKKTDLATLKKGGMCSGGKAKKYEEGGMTMVKDVPEDDKPPTDKKGKYIKPRPFASGGYVRAADGCATKGKTKGKVI